MSKLQILTSFVNQRLTSAVEEICVLFERTITEYEDEVSRLKEENERQRKLLDAVWNPEVHLHRADVQTLLLEQEWSSSAKRYDPQFHHIKEEKEELWICQGLEEADIAKFFSTHGPVKSENDEDEAQSSQLHQSQTEENGEAEPLASSSTEQITTQSDGEGCERPEPVRYLDPQGGEKYLDSSESKPEDNDDLKKTREPQSALNTNTKNKQAHLRDTGCNNENKSFICSECDKRFDFKSFLIRHMRIHTGEKPFICSVCGKKFNRKTNLTVHMQIHSGEKPFMCSVCEEGFTHKFSLTIHMRTHSGEKPCKCTVCGKGFNQKGTLTAHMRIHSGEKPFSCSDCGKRFNQKGTLTTHMRLHSGVKSLS